MTETQIENVYMILMATGPSVAIVGWLFADALLTLRAKLRAKRRLTPSR